MNNSGIKVGDFVECVACNDLIWHYEFEIGSLYEVIDISKRLSKVGIKGKGATIWVDDELEWSGIRFKQSNKQPFKVKVGDYVKCIRNDEGNYDALWVSEEYNGIEFEPHSSVNHNLKPDINVKAKLNIDNEEFNTQLDVSIQKLTKIKELLEEIHNMKIVIKTSIN